MIAVFDIETDGLYHDATTIHSIAIKVEDTPTRVYTSRPIKGSEGTLKEGLELLTNCSVLVGHNIINFDLPTIEKLVGWTYSGKIIDTLIVSKLKYPNILLIDSNRKSMPSKLKGRHSLKAWGYRLGNRKEQHEDWSKLSVAMVEYCRQDVEVNYTLYKQLFNKDVVPQEAIDLEQEFAKIISRQEKYGWLFDVKKAKALHIELIDLLEIATKELYETFKPINTWFPKDYPKVAIKKDGNKSQVLLTQESQGYHYNDDMEWGIWKEVEFNPSSPQHRIRFIEHYFGKIDWVLNDKGNPKTGEDDLIALFEDKDFAKPLVHYLNVKKLLGQLAEGANSWLNSIDSDNRIRGRVDTLGAVSRRCTHSKPNLAQVPSGKAFKGHECRELFIVGKGKKLVGCDADGLELRTLSHYMARHDGGSYATAVDKGNKDDGTDIHTLNQKGAGLPTRDDAKTFIYAFLYGAGDGKIGKIVGGTSKDGKRLKEKFFKQIPAIRQLVEGVKSTVESTGTLKALDGNKYYIRSQHSALNTLLQGAGALVMKYYLIEVDKELQKHYQVGIQYEFVGNIHDEIQIECDEDIADNVAKIAEEAFNTVTELLNFRIPLRGTADIGSTWNDTH